MNFQLFSTDSTNIFPIANSALGGQLCTEFNLRSRESICTDPSVPYMIGPSYTHSLDDFKIAYKTDAGGVRISTTAFTISPGRALVNGHYIESLVPLEIDIQEANIAQSQAGRTTLSGTLCVGLRVMYSTTQTIANAMTSEQNGMYRGIQVVLLNKSSFRLPAANVDPSAVNAHLKLGEIEYRNEEIITITPDVTRIQAITADRIGKAEQLLSNEYITKTGLEPKKLYAFSGKADYDSSEQNPWKDTWCDVTDSLMVWDNNPVLVDIPNGRPEGAADEARFRIGADTEVYLQIPHKQPDSMLSTAGVPQYYRDKFLKLPSADFTLGTSGVVTHSYTQNLKRIQEEWSTMQYRGLGHQVRYLTQIFKPFTIGYDEEQGQMCPINTNWHAGDYVLVGQDYSVDIAEGANVPSTMYVVLPAIINTVEYVGNGDSLYNLTGVSLAYLTYAQIEENNPEGNVLDRSQPDTWKPAIQALMKDTRGNPGYTVEGQLQYRDFVIVDAQEGEYASVDDTQVFYTYGNPLIVTDPAKGMTYSAPIWITTQVQLATESVVGGFLNVQDTDLGQGYIILDSDGHLRMLDYDRIMSGTLSYILADDYETSKGVDAQTIQEQLDNYVNQRVAFPSAQQIENSDPRVITITIDLTAEDTPQTINIYGIDSRFNTSVYIKFTGTANENLTVNIIDCEKVRLSIPSSVQDASFNLYRCNLFYDYEILDNLSYISGMKLWYERPSNEYPDLVVNDMTVINAGDPTPVTGLEYWTPASPNDNHYSYALRSITFSGDGSIAGCELYITDNLTANITTGTFTSVFKFKLPQSALGLSYPEKRLRKQLKVTGQFITAYPISSVTPKGYMIKNTSFSAVSQCQVTNANNVTTYTEGVISFMTTVSKVTAVNGIESTHAIDSWQTGEFHLFAGGIFK